MAIWSLMHGNCMTTMVLCAQSQWFLAFFFSFCLDGWIRLLKPNGDASSGKCTVEGGSGPHELAYLPRMIKLLNLFQALLGVGTRLGKENLIIIFITGFFFLIIGSL